MRDQTFKVRGVVLDRETGKPASPEGLYNCRVIDSTDVDVCPVEVWVAFAGLPMPPAHGPAKSLFIDPVTTDYVLGYVDEEGETVAPFCAAATGYPAL